MKTKIKYSCEDLQSSIYFAPNMLRHCCQRFFVKGKMKGDVEILKVKDILVCGHYCCGGVNAAFHNESHGLIDNWLRHIQDVYRFNQQKLDSIVDEEERMNMFCELNVIEQVANVCNTTVLKNAWLAKQNVTVHGLVYNLHDGILKDLNVSVSDSRKR